MLRRFALLFVTLSLTCASAGCGRDEPAKPETPATKPAASRQKAEKRAYAKALAQVPANPNKAAAQLPPGHPALPEPAKQTDMPVATNLVGTVVETMDAAGYTYVQVKSGKSTFWLAGPGTTLKAGDRIRAPKGALMRNFASKALDRTFPEIFFVDHIQVARETAPAGE